MLEFLVNLQRSIRAGLSADILSFSITHDWTALLAVLPLGIVFGAAHALTPGHSKSILAAYLVGSGQSRTKAVLTATALAVTHIGTAVFLALVTTTLVTRTIVGAGRTPVLEGISRWLLVAVGVWLLSKALWGRPHVHGEGVAVGFLAGLVPCPLTLFLMFYAASKGVPEAGLTFALSMVIGVGSILVLVAVLSTFARVFLAHLISRCGVSMTWIIRIIDGIAGATLMLLALSELTP